MLFCKASRLLRQFFDKTKSNISTEVKPQFIPNKPVESELIVIPRNNDEYLIDNVIELLKTNPQEFKANWSNPYTISECISNNNMTIMIIRQSGEIIRPFKPNMNYEQRQIILKLIAPIVQRDITEILDKLFIKK